MEHLTSSQIAQYLARRLPPEAVAALHAHTESCADCRSALEQAAMKGPQAFAVPLWEGREIHLSEEEMVAYVAGGMPEDGRAGAAEHLAVCEECRDSVEAMETVRGHGDAKPVRRLVSRRMRIAWALAAAVILATAIRFWPARQPAGPGSATVASLHDGGQLIELDSAGNLRGLPGASSTEVGQVRDALVRRSLPGGPGAAAQPTGVLLAPGKPGQALFSLSEPVNMRVLSDRPVFSWSARSGGSAYQVVVTNESLDPLARSGRIQATHWQPDAPLPRGEALLWQVRVWVNGGGTEVAPAPPAPPARFEIAGAAVATRIGELRAAAQPPHLLIAVLAAHEGLREEAARELRLLAAENPGSPLVESLMAGQPGR